MSRLAELRKLVTVTHAALVEDESPEQHYQSPGKRLAGDDALACEHIRQLVDKTPWGWCIVMTTVTVGDWSASVYLGGCSYTSAEDFAECDGEQQAIEACQALLWQLGEAVTRGKDAARLIERCTGA